MALASRANLAHPQACRCSTFVSMRRNSVCVRAAASSPSPEPKPASGAVKKEVVGKSILVETIAKNAGLTKADAAKALDSVLSGISDAVSDGKRVTIIGFGTFERRDRKERTALNPKTKEPMTVPATKAPAFKPSPQFKAKVNGTQASVKPKAASPAAAKLRPVAKPDAVQPTAAPPRSPSAAPSAAKKTSPATKPSPGSKTTK